MRPIDPLIAKAWDRKRAAEAAVAPVPGVVVRPAEEYPIAAAMGYRWAEGAAYHAVLAAKRAAIAAAATDPKWDDPAYQDFLSRPEP